MWIVFYATGILFGSTLIMIMWSYWSLTWKQIGVYMLLSFVSQTFFGAARVIRREQKDEAKNSGSLKQTT